ncbi:MAG TPA: HD domain-containing protein, partial [Candidatus Kapabacteria bacterium]|nr:HD domain-containing protein [Candidatus Kapabacteria bacterium]
IIEALNIDKLTFSAYALREGILFDTLQKQKAIQEFHHLSNLRYESVLHVCNEYRVIMKHALHVKQLSSDLFDALQPIHQLGDNEKELLEAAALLHDVGYHISPEQHHKHTYYLIKNCVLPGFTNDETEIIANIARYHRKSLPKRKHDNFIHLSPQEQKTVRILSGILRITEALDRRLIAAVASVKAITDKKNITIQLQLQQQDYVPDIEIWGAERRKDLLEQTLDITLNFQ